MNCYGAVAVAAVIPCIGGRQKLSVHMYYLPYYVLKQRTHSVVLAGIRSSLLQHLPYLAHLLAHFLELPAEVTWDDSVHQNTNCRRLVHLLIGDLCVQQAVRPAKVQQRGTQRSRL